MRVAKGKNIVVGVTGASGSVYARQTLEKLLASDEIERIGLIVSRRGAEVSAWEDNCELRIRNYGLVDDRMHNVGQGSVEASCDGDDCGSANAKIERFDNDDMFASPASGSARWDAMVVVPCSMGCVGRIASGVSGDLIARAADVMLKEGRTLIVVPRETPLGLIHLRNLTTLAEAGAVVLPASPSFYSHPETLEAVCATVTDRILSRLGIDAPRYEWGKQSFAGKP
jgi:4-hydroxy-3-polyprenylbenzoate decarboxylase